MKDNNTQYRYLWYAFFLCGFLTNYPATNNIVNLLIVVLFLVGILHRRGWKPSFTTYFIILMTAVSFFNNYVIDLNAVKGIEQDPNALPVLVIIVLASEWLYIPGILYKCLSYNCLPLAVLFLLGGVHSNEFGRIDTPYISANFNNVLYLMGFGATSYLLVHKGINKCFGIVTLISTMVMISFSGSRKDFVFVVCAAIFLYPMLKEYFVKFNKIKRFYIGILVTVVGSVMVYQILQAQLQRFSRMGGLAEIAASTDVEPSALERTDYIKTGFKVAESYPLGVGEDNIVGAIRIYGYEFCKLTKNVHSLLAQVLFAGGYLGLIMLTLLTLRLVKLSFRDIRRFYFIPLYFIMMIFADGMFLTKVLWPVLIFFEKEASSLPSRRILLGKKKSFHTLGTTN